MQEGLITINHRHEGEHSLTSTHPTLSPRYADALQFCFEIHAHQRRKGGSVPYIAHLLAVSALVMEQGGNEDEAIASLLHDAVEDCGGRPMLEKIRQRYGDTVAAIVEGCTDSFVVSPDAKEDWQARKERYLEHLCKADRPTLLVAACDKFHNLSNTVRDIRAGGAAVFARFKAGPTDQIWYYTRCAEIIDLAGLPIGRELRRELEEMILLAGSSRE